MGKTDFQEISETGNWNVAQRYSELKIMKHHALVDEYETLAKFGTSSFFDEMMYNIPEKQRDQVKIDSFKWLVHSLLMLIENSLFAMDRNKTEKNKLEISQTKLISIEDNIEDLYKKTFNQIKKTKSVKLLKGYKEKLKEVIKIKVELNEALNKADLIFTYKESYNPKEHKKRIFEEATTKG